MRSPPRLILQLGLYRSASTWACNVIAELLRLDGPASLIFADTADALAKQIGGSPQVVVKAHMPDPALQLLAHLSRVPVVMTVRDPLDCIVSLHEQFFEPLERSANAIVGSSNLMLRMLKICDPLVLRYESQPRDAAAVAMIAEHIGVTADKDAVTAITGKLEAKAVDAFIGGLLASGYFGKDPQVVQAHAETQWHPRHLGDGSSGRHVQILPPAQIAAVDAATEAFRRRFGYLRDGK